MQRPAFTRATPGASDAVAGGLGPRETVLHSAGHLRYIIVDSLKSNLFFFNLKKIYLFIWLCWVFVAACGLSLVAASGGYSLLRCTGFSLRWLLLLRSMGSRCVGFSSCGTGSVVVARGLSSCGARA